MAELLLDTDVFVDHLRGEHQLQPGADLVHYSIITRCELFAGPADQEGAVGKLLAAFTELPVDRRIAEQAGRIRRETAVLAPDALIAATALAHRLTLVTHNLRDFERIPKLNVKPPRRR